MVDDDELGGLGEVTRLSLRLVLQVAPQAEATEFLGLGRCLRGGRPPPSQRPQLVTVKTTARPILLEPPKTPGSPERFLLVARPPVTKMNALGSLAMSVWMRGVSDADARAMRCYRIRRLMLTEGWLTKLGRQRLPSLPRLASPTGLPPAIPANGVVYRTWPKKGCALSRRRSTRCPGRTCSPSATRPPACWSASALAVTLRRLGERGLGLLPMRRTVERAADAANALMKKVNRVGQRLPNLDGYRRGMKWPRAARLRTRTPRIVAYSQ